MIAGNDMANGCASSLTDRLSRPESRASNARRVGSASAANVWSKALSLYLTIQFSIRPNEIVSTSLGGSEPMSLQNRRLRQEGQHQVGPPLDGSGPEAGLIGSTNPKRAYKREHA
jgi:hypothetical protein